jgi:hypothetical protein
MQQLAVAAELAVHTGWSGNFGAGPRTEIAIVLEVAASASELRLVWSIAPRISND